jgi:hypothetical protein
MHTYTQVLHNGMVTRDRVLDTGDQSSKTQQDARHKEDHETTTRTRVNPALKERSTQVKDEVPTSGGQPLRGEGRKGGGEATHTEELHARWDQHKSDDTTSQGQGIISSSHGQDTS